MAKTGLGKGLSALIGARPVPAVASDSADPENTGRVRAVELADIVASPLQPRKEFAPAALRDLVDSIREHGIIQPLVVREVNGKCELIAGERRWRAAQELRLTSVPVIIREASDRDVLELSLIENLQRADLNPIEEAQAYERLASEFALRQEDIAQKVGRSRESVANAMRLLDLHPQIQSWVTQNLLSVGHAKVLLGLKEPNEQLAVAETILRRSATVRDAEKLVARQKGNARPRRKRTTDTQPMTGAVISDLQTRLQEHLGTRVTLRHGDKRGRIEVEYYGDDDLQRVLGAMGLADSQS